MIDFIRSSLSPWWNRRLAQARLRRFLKFLRTDPDFSPVVYDVGARWGISPPFDRIKELPSLRTVGFEPDPDEAAKLESSSAFSRVCPVAVGAREESRTLHLAKDPGCSSLFPPNFPEIELHTNSPRFETVGTIQVATIPLDQAVARFDLPAPDFLKVDCEGAEGEIIDGAPLAMAHVSGITFEARFRDFYSGGAVLGDLTQRLFDLGFVCIKLDPIGYFHGTLMMFDVSMVRHASRIGSHRELLAAVLFCLIHDNWQHAHHLASKRARDFGFDDLEALLRR
jgi:FkbM family methyltransferase